MYIIFFLSIQYYKHKCKLLESQWSVISWLTIIMIIISNNKKNYPLPNNNMTCNTQLNNYLNGRDNPRVSLCFFLHFPRRSLLDRNSCLIYDLTKVFFYPSFDFTHTLLLHFRSASV